MECQQKPVVDCYLLSGGGGEFWVNLVSLPVRDVRVWVVYARLAAADVT